MFPCPKGPGLVGPAPVGPGGGGGDLHVGTGGLWISVGNEPTLDQALEVRSKPVESPGAHRVHSLRHQEKGSRCDHDASADVGFATSPKDHHHFALLEPAPHVKAALDVLACGVALPESMPHPEPLKQHAHVTETLVTMTTAAAPEAHRA